MRAKDERYYKAYLENKTISRRGLFRAFVSGTKNEGGRRADTTSSGCTASNNAVQDTSFVAELLRDSQVIKQVARPPGAINESLFQNICTGCGECESACPEKVIILNGALPELILDYGYCSQCGECQQSCPTGALHGTEKDIQLRPQFAKNCQNSLFGECELCAIQCPHQAISITSFKQPQLDVQSCDGCSRCKQACPFSVITMQLDV
ncbi:ferredoxin-type protein NapF [Moritella sp. Urea-trap-13]|uniref:ferredoxin-type protein NapF n=1 Tax=Moritella sp. Urea-trap-13 TaxID=2058327 RepID=UPI000C31FA8E|nr:ferredoxin-type protein NapF [Moritella sp. Urea-trap-13]PKH05404.1 ferredoxin-type protein NapF [Moritella sp. Urea-trap-13]